MPKGVWFQKYKRADGAVVRYGYLGRGAGTKPLGQEGTPEFHEKLAAALRSAPDEKGVSFLVHRYKTSKEFGKLRPRTQADYRKQLDKVEAKWGKLPITAMASPQVADRIYRWRDEMAEASPRQADYAISVLSAMLAWSVRRGLIDHNRAAGVGDVYASERSGKTWSESQVLAVWVVAQEPVRRAMALALETGLAQEDLLVLPKSAIAGDVVQARRLKNGAAVAIPVSPRLQAALDAAPDTLCANVLTKADGTPWDAKGNGLRSAFREACQEAGVEGLTFHDMRGTFITRRKVAGWSPVEVSLCSGHKIRDEAGAQAAYTDRAAWALASAKSVAERFYGAKPEPATAPAPTHGEQNLQSALQSAGG